MERHKYTPAFHLHRFPPGHHHFPAFLINVFILQIFTPFPPFWLSQPLLALCSVKSTVLLWLTGKNTQANFKQLTLYLCQRFTPEGQIVPHSFPENKKYTLKLVKILFQCVILSFSKSPESYLFLEVTRLASMGERERETDRKGIDIQQMSLAASKQRTVPGVCLRPPFSSKQWLQTLWVEERRKTRTGRTERQDEWKVRVKQGTERWKNKEMWIKDEGTREQMYQQIYVGVSVFYPFLPLCSRLIISPINSRFHTK